MIAFARLPVAQTPRNQAAKQPKKMFNPWLAWSVKVVQMAKFAAGCAEHRGNHFRTALTGNGIAGERRYVSVMFCDLVGSISISAKLDAELPLEP